MNLRKFSFNTALILEYLELVVNSLRKRYLRTTLTMIGIFIGIAAVVALVSLSEGLKLAVQEQFEALGADKLIISYRGDVVPGLSASSGGLTLKDYKFIKRLKQVENTIYWYFDSAKVVFKDQTLFLPVIAYPTDDKQELFNEMWYFDIKTGRTLKKNDKYKINTGIAFFEDKVFLDNLKIRDKLTINGLDFKIVGYYERVGNSQDDKNIFIEEATFKELFNVDEQVSIMVAKVRPSLKPSAVANIIEKKLREFRGLKEGQEDFVIQSSEEFMKAVSDILNIIQIVLVGIAGISLFVGGIGIMNTMYTAVTERTKEVGIMKAIGARNEDIFLMFLIESGLLGFSGGLIGILIGMGFAKLVEYFALSILKTNLLSPQFSGFLILGSLFFASFIGAVSGTFPAMQASKLAPIEALRYE